jgi:hypothetical protein
MYRNLILLINPGVLFIPYNLNLADYFFREPLVIIKWFSVAVICCTSAIFVYGLRIFQRFKFRHIPGGVKDQTIAQMSNKARAKQEPSKDD